MYRFKIRGTTIELPEPTQEAFDNFYEETLLSIFFTEEIKTIMVNELQQKIDDKDYEITNE